MSKLDTGLGAGLLLAAMLLCTFLAGCGNRSEKMDERDLQHPLMQKASEEKESGDLDEAISLYRKALEERPDLARAHLELALLYDEPNGDEYLRAIYHFERYLEERPNTEKRDIVEALIMAAKMSYASTLPNKPEGALEMIAKLKRENKLLRDRLAEAGADGDLSSTEKGGGGDHDKELEATEGGQFSMPGPDPAEDAIEFYTVKQNDTLSRIARKMYNNPNKWKVIYEANRDTLDTPESLKTGQKLVIPNLRD